MRYQPFTGVVPTGRSLWLHALAVEQSGRVSDSADLRQNMCLLPAGERAVGHAPPGLIRVLQKSMVSFSGATSSHAAFRPSVDITRDRQDGFSSLCDILHRGWPKGASQAIMPLRRVRRRAGRNLRSSSPCMAPRPLVRRHQAFQSGALQWHDGRPSCLHRAANVAVRRGLRAGADASGSRQQVCHSTRPPAARTRERGAASEKQQIGANRDDLRCHLQEFQLSLAAPVSEANVPHALPVILATHASMVGGRAPESAPCRRPRRCSGRFRRRTQRSVTQALRHTHTHTFAPPHVRCIHTCRSSHLEGGRHLMLGGINNEFNMHVSDGAVIGPHVSSDHAPGARASGVTLWMSELGVHCSSTFFAMGPSRVGRFAQRSTSLDHVLTSWLEVRVSDPRNSSDHSLVGAVVASCRMKGRKRRPRFVAIRPLGDGVGDLDARIAGQCRLGASRGNKSTISRHMSSLA